MKGSLQFWQAVRAGFALDYRRVSVLAAHVKKGRAVNGNETALLGGLVLLARNAPGDFAKAMALFSKVQKSLERQGLSADRMAENVYELYVVVLYAKASILYYREGRDMDSLRVFKRCLDALRSHDRRNVRGVVRLSDVRRKVDSLSFLTDGYVKAERMEETGRWASAARLLDLAINGVGVDYLDHEVVLLAAKAHLALGHVRRGRALACAAYEDSPTCLETKFVYALTLFDRRDEDSARQFVDLAKDFVKKGTRTTCRLSPGEKTRMKKVLAALLESLRHRDIHARAAAGCSCPEFVTKGRINFQNVLWYNLRHRKDASETSPNTY